MSEPILRPRILDNQYGLIYFTDIEKKIIDSTYFQRLRKIKQLGVADLVFPGAQHTRFIHSLGVLELTERVFQSLIRKAKEHDEKEKLDELENDRRIMRMAALLHDIGHYPLSHTLESAYQCFDKCPSQIEEVEFNFAKQNESEHRESPYSNNLGNRMDHEHIGVRIIHESEEIQKILKNGGFNEEDIKDIENSIIGSRAVRKLYYMQILHSDLDVDTLDYCLRDSTAAGIQYGKYDINYLMDNVEICELKIARGQPILAFREKAIHTLEHYLLARHFYYLQVLYHPKRLFFEEAAKRFAIECIQIGWLPKPDDYLNQITNIESNIKFNDSLFWQLCYFAISDKRLNGSNPTDRMKVYAKCLLERIVPDVEVVEYRIDISDQDTLNKRKHDGKMEELRNKTTDGFDISEPFKFLDVTFTKENICNYELCDKCNKICGGIFGRFYNDFHFTKTMEEYKRKHPETVSNENFILESRDAIRYIDAKTNEPKFLSERRSSLAYILARNKIGHYLHFESE